MNPVIERIITIFKEMPFSRKIALGVFAMVLVAGFSTLFIWTNKTQFKTAYSGLTKEDAASVVDMLKASNTPYHLAGDGTTIMVPEDIVYDVRLSMAKEGIPKGGGVGFEIFDKTEFGTTEFVQKINKKRAIQGELARTISAFDEVKTARVMIVLPKESVFVEEVKKPSASILLELNSDLEKEKVTAIAHLVASSIQDLTPKLVTIVDTAGRILFEGKSEEEQAKITARNMADAQYQYKVRFEENLTRRIQTMLERIVGKDKAIVRVTSEMDFSENDMNEEIYDPFERGGEFIRSRKNRAEKVTTTSEETPTPSSVNPIVGTQDLAGEQNNELVNKRDDTFNYEISKRVRETRKPMAVLTRLSVAAVIDGKYEYKTDESGNKQKVYLPRSPEEMKQFQDIVIKSMGYNEQRSDQVSMECFPFASIAEIESEPMMSGFKMVQKEYGRTIANLLLVVLLFLFVIRPIIKTVKEIKTTVEQEALPGPEDLALIADDEEKELEFIEMDSAQQKEYINLMTAEQKETFLKEMSSSERAVYLSNMPIDEKARYYAQKDFDKTVNILKGWMIEKNKEED
ncbi:flagellar basal-body MS-ring/collar protein FliF [Desulfobacula toluolica]|uniref:Flagellar M-ring protein n=1 Tax=Desulfobacula toluolica (strain DSM 7467 / Tol2) TaxID=651182 RepID=K0NNU7_DESTT|nr:flagellar basal-body MS-ring/collar protein FliF [Desulfobacula toluolica]CCK81743.1 FliF: flagellar M-ring protein [Desulfobacula toluolica Tol2]